VGLEEPHQTRPLRHLREQLVIVTYQPAIEGPPPSPFDGKQEGERDHFTWVESGLWVLRHVKHLLVHVTEQCHTLCLICAMAGSQRCVAERRV
jgi:hypothetical protein